MLENSAITSPMLLDIVSIIMASCSSIVLDLVIFVVRMNNDIFGNSSGVETAEGKFSLKFFFLGANRKSVLFEKCPFHCKVPLRHTETQSDPFS
jgi:hypothetical protein